jgi:hypothetical protein
MSTIAFGFYRIPMIRGLVILKSQIIHEFRAWRMFAGVGWVAHLRRGWGLKRLTQMKLQQFSHFLFCDLTLK